MKDNIIHIQFLEKLPFITSYSQALYRGDPPERVFSVSNRGVEIWDKILFYRV